AARKSPGKSSVGALLLLGDWEPRMLDVSFDLRGIEMTEHRVRLAERDRVGLGRHVALVGVEVLVLAEDDVMEGQTTFNPGIWVKIGVASANAGRPRGTRPRPW
ncbi:MAG: hypothetical protein WA869_37100, partial [Alloacidobacterium sp.]